MKGTKYYVSITGLKLKSFYHAPKFWFHAIPSMIQAKKAPGNVSADARTVNGIHHTLTVWTDRKSMIKFMVSGDHAKAMKIFDDIATGKTYGYETDEIPSWEEAVQIYEEKGIEYVKRKQGPKPDQPMASEAHVASSH